MNRYVILAIIVSVLFIPVSFASAETIKFHSNENEGDDYPPIYAFVQVTHRNSNGDLLAVIQSEKMTNISPYVINYYIDKEVAREDRKPQFIQNGGHTMELFMEIFTNKIDRVDMTASTLLMVSVPTPENPDERKPVLAARFAHDGLLLNPGDIVTTNWYFIRLL